MTKITPELEAAYRTLAKQTLATPDKRGIFPIGAMEVSPDGSAMTPVPLTHAMTQKTFDAMREFMAAFKKEFL